MLDIQDLYQQRVASCAAKFKKVILKPYELKSILEIANKITHAKMNETSYKKDGASLLKRYVNGLKGEAAVGKLLGMTIINPGVGVSTEFDTPDIPGYSIGVKTVEYGKFPVIPKLNMYPQIICICHPSLNEVVYVCGLAETTDLNNFQYDDLILDPSLKEKGTKTGYWGFSQLKEVSKDTIEPYKIDLESKTVEVTKCIDSELKDYKPTERKEDSTDGV